MNTVGYIGECFSIGINSVFTFATIVTIVHAQIFKTHLIIFSLEHIYFFWLWQFLLKSLFINISCTSVSPFAYNCINNLERINLCLNTLELNLLVLYLLDLFYLRINTRRRWWQELFIASILNKTDWLMWFYSIFINTNIF